MQIPIRPALLGAVALLSVAPALVAQGVTPTHRFETPLGFDPFNGEVTFATMIGPPEGETILRTDLIIDWTPNGAQPASAFGMKLRTSMLESGPSPTWTITGAGLGWGSAPGTHSATTSTNFFNDTLVSGLPGFPTVFDLTLEAAGGGGLFGAIGPQSKLVFLLGPRLAGDVASVSLSSGGAQTLDVSAGPTVGPGLLYLVVGSASGTTPALQLDGVVVPLVPDAYAQWSLGSPNAGPFVGTLGFLDGSGTASAQIVVPPSSNPALAGLVLNHAALIVDPVQGRLLSATNPLALTLAP